MLIHEKIAERINDAKRNALDEAQALINSSSGRVNALSVIEVRNMRMRIIKDFKILNTQLLSIIQDDIRSGVGDDMNGIKTRLEDLRKKLTDAESEQELITEQWKELKEINRRITTGRR